MIIYLRQSKLFTVAPEIRFAKEYRLPKDVWLELWKRHALMDYTLADLCDLFETKTKGRTTTPQAMQRWIWRTYVYGKAQDVLKKGVEVVTSDFFGNYEMDVIKELTKNLRSSVRQEVKTLI